MLILYKNIKNRRIELGMSQQELAEKTGYTDRSSIAKIESGKVDLTQSKILAFAEALKTTPSWLMGAVEDQKPFSKDITDDDIKFALFGNSDVTEQMYEDLKDFVQYIKSKYKKD